MVDFPQLGDVKMEDPGVSLPQIQDAPQSSGTSVLRGQRGVNSAPNTTERDAPYYGPMTTSQGHDCERQKYPQRTTKHDKGDTPEKIRLRSRIQHLETKLDKCEDQAQEGMKVIGHYDKEERAKERRE